MRGRREDSCCLGDGFGCLFLQKQIQIPATLADLGFFFFFNFIIFRKLDLDCSLFPGRLLTQFKQGEKTRTTKRLKNILVKQTIQNIYVFCWFLLAAVCLQMSSKWSQEALHVKIQRVVSASSSNGQGFHLCLSFLTIFLWETGVRQEILG